jgi:hypothetical protein
MIECSLRPQGEYPCLKREDGKIKLGRYHSSYFHLIDGFPVAVYIDGSFKEYFKSGKTEEEVLKECIEYLNSKTEGKRKKKSIFDILTFHSYSYKLDEETGEGYFVALLVVKDRQNKLFWGEGKKK